MEILLSFAQEQEDIILYHMLKNVDGPIRYIDVGANDPVYLSVTKFFANRGGKGVNVEPQHGYIEKLDLDRPKDINIEAGISNKPGTLELYGDGTGATFDSKLVQAEAAHQVPVITLESLCKQYIPPETDVHFLKIDVEGFERQCLEGADFKKYRPWIVCMESTLPGTDIPAWDEWESILLSQEYVFVGMSGINRYYVAKEKVNDLNEFCSAEQLHDKYEILIYSSVKEDKRKAREYDENKKLLKTWPIRLYKHIFIAKDK